MKYLILALLLVGCATKKPKVVEPKVTPIAPKTRTEKAQENIMRCVDRYIDRDAGIKIHEAFEVCKGIYKRN